MKRKKKQNNKKKYYLMSKNISLQGRGICHYQRLRAKRIHAALLLVVYRMWLCLCRAFFSVSHNKKLLVRTNRVEEKKWKDYVNQSYKQIAKKSDLDCARHSCLFEGANDWADEKKKHNKSVHLSAEIWNQSKGWIYYLFAWIRWIQFGWHDLEQI